jgi:hypothetical protein
MKSVILIICLLFLVSPFAVCVDDSYAYESRFCRYLKYFERYDLLCSYCPEDPVCEVSRAAEPVCTDWDEDGFSAQGEECGPRDCNDENPNVNPEALEICTDDIDNDCDGKIDEEDCIDFMLDILAEYECNTMWIKFFVGPASEPVTWNAWLIYPYAPHVVLVVSEELPALPAREDYVYQLQEIDEAGSIGILTTFSTTTGGVVGSDWLVVERRPCTW